MTRPRVFGEDTPFSAWLRQNPLLKSTEEPYVSASDIDMVIHKYAADYDRFGVQRKKQRDFQHVLILEVKTRMGQPTASQCETMKFLNSFILGRSSADHKAGKRPKSFKSRDLWSRIAGKDVCVRMWGIHLLQLEGVAPEIGKAIKWDGQQICYRTLERILRFDLCPWPPFEDMHKVLRRHHKYANGRIQS